METHAGLDRREHAGVRRFFLESVVVVVAIVAVGSRRR
jgi:hypothetical protein